jgi:hypothetical protein
MRRAYAKAARAQGAAKRPEATPPRAPRKQPLRPRCASAGVASGSQEPPADKANRKARLLALPPANEAVRVHAAGAGADRHQLRARRGLEADAALGCQSWSSQAALLPREPRHGQERSRKRVEAHAAANRLSCGRRCAVASAAGKRAGGEQTRRAGSESNPQASRASTRLSTRLHSPASVDAAALRSVIARTRATGQRHALDEPRLKSVRGDDSFPAALLSRVLSPAALNAARLCLGAVRTPLLPTAPARRRSAARRQGCASAQQVHAARDPQRA